MSQVTTSSKLRPFKPTRFGRYTLLFPLSAGGMGDIVLARQDTGPHAGKLCVIKKIRAHLASEQDFAARFVNEGRILVTLDHPHIAHVLDMGLEGEEPYIALELVDGKDLRRVISRMRDRKMQVQLSFALYVMTRVLDGLAWAHAMKGPDGRPLDLVHRDVSPQNILISYDGEVKLIDFGLAKSTLNITKTNPTIVLGKFLYMSPEQARHQQVDRRSDLYAAGLCLYELVAGKNPFEDLPSAELMARVASPVITPLSAVEPLCPPALDEVVMRALLTDPARRFQKAEDMRDALQKVLEQIDPNGTANAASASRFLREAFTSEYGTERRMMSTMLEQARQLFGDALPGPAASERATIEMPQVFGGDDKTPLPAEPPGGPLSFQPTPKTSGATGTGDLFGDEPTAPRRLSKVLDTDPTEAAVPALPEPEPEPQPSIIVDGLPEEAPPPAAPSPPPGARAKKDAPAEGVRKKKKKATPPQGARPSSPRKASAPLEPAPQTGENVGDTTGPMNAPSPANANAAAPKKGGSALVWVVVPLVAILGLGAYIGWDMYTEQLKRERQVVDTYDPITVPTPPPEPRKSREVRVGPQISDEEIAPLPTLQPDKPKVAPKPKVAVKLTAAQKALKDLEADMKRVENANSLRKFTLPLNVLKDKVRDHPDDTSVVKELESMHAEVRKLLEAQ